MSTQEPKGSQKVHVELVSRAPKRKKRNDDESPTLPRQPLIGDPIISQDTLQQFGPMYPPYGALVAVDPSIVRSTGGSRNGAVEQETAAIGTSNWREGRVSQWLRFAKRRIGIRIRFRNGEQVDTFWPSKHVRVRACDTTAVDAVVSLHVDANVEGGSDSDGDGNGDGDCSRGEVGLHPTDEAAEPSGGLGMLEMDSDDDDLDNILMQMGGGSLGHLSGDESEADEFADWTLEGIASSQGKKLKKDSFPCAENEGPDSGGVEDLGSVQGQGRGSKPQCPAPGDGTQNGDSAVCYPVGVVGDESRGVGGDSMAGMAVRATAGVAGAGMGVGVGMEVWGGAKEEADLYFDRVLGAGAKARVRVLQGDGLEWTESRINRDGTGVCPLPRPLPCAPSYTLAGPCTCPR